MRALENGPIKLAVFLLAIGILNAEAVSQVISSELTQIDKQLDTGEYCESWTIQVAEGQQLNVRMTSDELDPYLMIFSPSDREGENDDASELNRTAELQVPVTEAGEWTIVATTFKPGETGSYELLVVIGGQPAGEDIVSSGSLGPEDKKLQSGEWMDSYTFVAEAGQQLSLDMRSADFDTYLMVVLPSGEKYSNPSYQERTDRSLISFRAPESGEYRVLLTTEMPGERGEYTFEAHRWQTLSPLNDGQSHSESGSLDTSDSTFSTGEYREIFQLPSNGGQRLTISLRSDDFDSFLSVYSPSGERIVNDDFGENRNSRIEIQNSEEGTYRVYATSYEFGEVGQYRLDISASESEFVTIHTGQQLDLQLNELDSQTDNGFFEDFVLFNGNEGQIIRLDMIADFDTTLRITTPSGNEFYNDDISEEDRNSRLEVSLPEDGVYTISTSSYSAEQTGEYRLAMSEIDEIVVDEIADVGGRMFGIFAGISDYDDRQLPLNSCADDAVRIRDVLEAECGLQSQDSYLLANFLDSDALSDESAMSATRQNFVESINAVAEDAGPGDTVVVFFSGHGGQRQRADNPPTDADGIDETLIFFDEALSDDELADLLGNIDDQALIIVVIDSCFSGGFAKDIVASRNRVGLFSSEEDVQSLVAAKFTAGGYLSYFFCEAIEDGAADANEDRGFTAHEVYTYVRTRYRQELNAEVTRIVGHSEGASYQVLVTDDSIVPDSNILFRR